jgi:hypothetical protein
MDASRYVQTLLGVIYVLVTLAIAWQVTIVTAMVCKFNGNNIMKRG